MLCFRIKSPPPPLTHGRLIVESLSLFLPSFEWFWGLNPAGTLLLSDWVGELQEDSLFISVQTLDIVKSCWVPCQLFFPSTYQIHSCSQCWKNRGDKTIAGRTGRSSGPYKGDLPEISASHKCLPNSSLQKFGIGHSSEPPEKQKQEPPAVAPGEA